MQLLKISYTVWKKHGDNLYCRVRQPGVKPLDVNLHTTDKVKAEAFIKLRRSELEMYNSYILAGETVPEDVANKLLRRGAPAVGAGQAVSTQKAMDSWEAYLRRIGRREATISSYIKNVRLTIPADAPVSSYTRKSIQQYLATHDALKPASRKMYSVCVREFLKFCISEYGIDRGLLDSWQKVRVEQIERNYLTIQQVAKVIKNVKCMDKDAETCYKAWFWFLFSTGCRQREGGLVEWTDIVDGSVVFRSENTKTNHTRRVPLESRVLDMINRLPRKGKLVFADIADSQPGRYSVFAKAVKRAGDIPKSGLHTLRHSASMYLYAHCSDIKLVSQMLGHSPEVALRYYQASREADQLRDVVDKSLGSEILLPDNMDELIDAGLI